MEDRISEYPGRIKLIPVAGQENVYDVERADEPLQEGTPLNKANLLKDGTIQRYVGTNIEVPDDIFNYLGTFAEYWWKKIIFSTKSWEPVFTVQTKSQSETSLTSGPFRSEIVIDQNDGSISLTGTSIYLNSSDTADTVADKIKGKYLDYTGNTSIKAIIWFHSDLSASDITINSRNLDITIASNKWDKVTTQFVDNGDSSVSFVHSNNRNSYPDSGQSGGSYYEYYGVSFGEKTRTASIEEGFYTGTGVNTDATTPISIQFTIMPKYVFLSLRDYDNLVYKGTTALIIAIHEESCSSMFLYGGNSYSFITSFNPETKTLTFYFGGGGEAYLNEAGKIYYYVALG